MAALLHDEGDSSLRYILDVTPTTIGRDPGNTLVFADPMIARRHAEIRRLGDGSYQLVDLGSPRGTFVGGHRVTEVVLVHGDEILIGPVRLRFENSMGEAASLPPNADAAPPRVRERLQTIAPRFAPSAEIADVDKLRRNYE